MQGGRGGAQALAGWRRKEHGARLLLGPPLIQYLSGVCVCVCVISSMCVFGCVCVCVLMLPTPRVGSHARRASVCVCVSEMAPLLVFSTLLPYLAFQSIPPRLF